MLSGKTSCPDDAETPKAIELEVDGVDYDVITTYGVTEIWEGGDELFQLRGTGHSLDAIAGAIRGYRIGHDDGVAIGRLRLGVELRNLIFPEWSMRPCDRHNCGSR